MTSVTATRHCPTCGDAALRPVETTAYTRRGEIVGRAAIFRCGACGAHVTITEPHLLAAWALGVLVLLGMSVGLAVLGAGWTGGYGGAVILGWGFLLCGGAMAVVAAITAWFVLKMVRTQLKSSPAPPQS